MRKAPIFIEAFRQLRGEDLNLRLSDYEAKTGPFRLATQRHEIIHNYST